MVNRETPRRNAPLNRGIVDRDFVETSNLQRQVLFDEQDVLDRLPKAIAASRKLRQINSTIRIEDYVDDLNAELDYESAKVDVSRSAAELTRALGRTPGLP